MVKGAKSTFLMRFERRSRRSRSASDWFFLPATTALMYFRKSTPHFSHWPPCRCSCLHEGHSKRSVMWQRGQNRAMSRASVPHFGHFIRIFYRDARARAARTRTHALTRLTLAAGSGESDTHPWRDAAHDFRSSVGSAYLECGGLPPLFLGEACFAQSEALVGARLLPARRSAGGGFLGSLLQHVPASRDGIQRRQAAALQRRQGDPDASSIGGTRQKMFGGPSF
jgi:hypothetical protein